MTLHPVLLEIPADETLTGPERVARQRAVARQALGLCAAELGLEHLEWTQDADDVPQPCGAYHWSISHKPQWTAAVIADLPVGIDIEHVVPRRPELVREVGTEGEWATVGGSDWPRFFRVWTAKEAVLKANGVGLGELDACRVTAREGDAGLGLTYNGRQWVVRHLTVDGHVAAVTAGHEPLVWHVHHLDGRTLVESAG
ncbi:MAG: 4'-phosphopantetheinyl transferase superfamily protein [bacterium]|nr:4'-phosphopantetheinyl transferase superfamily protein [bacterium]